MLLGSNRCRRNEKPVALHDEAQYRDESTSGDQEHIDAADGVNDHVKDLLLDLQPRFGHEIPGNTCNDRLDLALRHAGESILQAVLRSIDEHGVAHGQRYGDPCSLCKGDEGCCDVGLLMTDAGLHGRETCGSVPISLLSIPRLSLSCSYHSHYTCQRRY